MKNLIYVLAFTIFIVSCGDNTTENNSRRNSSIENNINDTNSRGEISGREDTTSDLIESANCIYCDKNENHVIDAFIAGTLIKKFQTHPYFQDLESYGGTICRDSKNETSLINLEKMLLTDILRFHYCYISKTTFPMPKNLFLAFEYGKCDDNERTQPGVLGNCVVSAGANYLKIFSPNELKLNDYEFADLILNFKQALVKKNESMDKFQVDSLNSNALKYLGNEYIKCQCEGNFNYNHSIKEILDDPKTLNGGFRYYFGLSDDSITNKIRVILVGVDSLGKNLNIWRETSMPHDKI